jgi:hypothetical protein
MEHAKNQRCPAALPSRLRYWYSARPLDLPMPKTLDQTHSVGLSILWSDTEHDA